MSYAPSGDNRNRKKSISACKELYRYLFTYVAEVPKILFKIKTHLKQPICDFIEPHLGKGKVAPVPN
jgi:hypothetical protein